MTKQHAVSITGMSKIVAFGIIAMIATIQLSNYGSVMAAVGSDFVFPRIVDMEKVERKAPIAISGDNVYIVWPTNRTGNDEVNFRASTDGGQIFGDKINLSNSTDANSRDVEIAADGDNVIITWWEHNQTAEEPLAVVSSDNGSTFGPLLRLATNGTIGEAAGAG